MDLTISDCYDILAGLSFSVFGIIIWAIVCALIALVVCITLMLIFRKTIMVKRAHVILKVIAVAYFVILPFLGGFFAFKWGIADGVEDELKKTTAKYTTDLNKKFNEVIKTAVESLSGDENSSGKMDLSADNFVERLSDKLLVQYQKTLEGSTEEKGFKGKVMAITLKITKSKGISYVIKKSIRELLEKTIHVDQDYTKEMMGKKLNELMKEDLFSKILDAQIDHFFGRMKKSVIILFLIILILPAVEVAIAHWYFRKSNKTENPTPWVSNENAV